ncbi:hypothetical protein [Corynebacterium uterequi]|uniref:hypothetical protein n=1 Tax=Corynebacterium uterequi TaxID=1072256 RepID=UPI0011876DBB|nr:hypothetical protein [Corynebacterium uterequi]
MSVVCAAASGDETSTVCLAGVCDGWSCLGARGGDGLRILRKLQYTAVSKACYTAEDHQSTEKEA